MMDELMHKSMLDHCPQNTPGNLVPGVENLLISDGCSGIGKGLVRLSSADQSDSVETQKGP